MIHYSEIHSYTRELLVMIHLLISGEVTHLCFDISKQSMCARLKLAHNLILKACSRITEPILDQNL